MPRPLETAYYDRLPRVISDLQNELRNAELPESHRRVVLEALNYLEMTRTALVPIVPFPRSRREDSTT